MTQSEEWEKIFASYSSDRELILRIHKELKLQQQKNNMSFKRANDLSRYFPQKNTNDQYVHENMFIIFYDQRNTNKHNEIFSSPLKMAISKKQKNSKCWQGWRKREILIFLVETENILLKKQKNDYYYYYFLLAI